MSAAGGTQGLQAINTMEFSVRALRGWSVPYVVPVGHCCPVFGGVGTDRKRGRRRTARDARPRSRSRRSVVRRRSRRSPRRRVRPRGPGGRGGRLIRAATRARASRLDRARSSARRASSGRGAEERARCGPPSAGPSSSSRAAARAAPASSSRGRRSPPGARDDHRAFEHAAGRGVAELGVDRVVLVRAHRPVDVDAQVERDERDRDERGVAPGDPRNGERRERGDAEAGDRQQALRHARVAQPG